MKKSIFTIILACLMLFNLHGQADSIANKMTVEVEFQNPQMDVSINDQRDKDYIDVFTQILNENLLTNSLLEETLAETNTQLTDILQIRKEERSMSAMDYLIQKTNLDEQEINILLNKYYKAIKLAYQILAIFFIIIIYIYIVDRRNTDWKIFLTRGITLILLLYLACEIIPTLIEHFVASDYIKLEHLIQLTT